VSPEKIKYTDISKIPPDFTEKMNREYNWMARIYDIFMLLFPLWKKWIKPVIPHISGSKILEVSFGTAYLMTQYAREDLEIYGIDFNQKMLELATKKMESNNIKATLSLASVEKLPFPDNTFDTVINTMAFTAYPDGDKAMSELKRVLKQNGRLLLVDIDYPIDRNYCGYLMVRLWEKLGDIIKDIPSLLEKYDFEYQNFRAGGFGSVHLFVARKK